MTRVHKVRTVAGKPVRVPAKAPVPCWICAKVRAALKLVRR